jgi:ribosomal protein S18 acetylase RimI-like enzyme
VTGTPPIRLATGADRAGVAAMLAHAFADDPAFAHIFPDPVVRARRLPRLFALLYDSDGRAGLRLLAPDDRAGGIAAAALWRAPGRASVGWGEMLRHAVPLLAALGAAAGRAMRVGNAIDAHQPAGAYWYLHVLGCDPAMQGRGLGGAVLRAGLARVAGRLPCYLETATEANLGFYAGLGFAVTAEWRVPGGGPRFWSMLRPPE